jgi:putative addiction module component (TIGR02574 family)
MSVDLLLKEIKALPIEQRIEFAQRIWDDITETVESRPSSDELAEIDRRLAEHRQNPADVVPWEEAKARLDHKFKR